MNAIIIEDEKPAAEKLQKAVADYDVGIKIVAVLGSVKEAITWLKNHDQPELAFMDIELGDGSSFLILEQGLLKCPVIFTTAYDSYWQEGFEHNSIDYLLKPIRQDKLEAALKKYDSLRKYFTHHFEELKNWHRHPAQHAYKKRFLVKKGTDYISVLTEEIAYFYATHKLVCMVDNANQKYILDQSLADIEKQLDPSRFYRATRKHLISVEAIKRMQSYPKGKLRLMIQPELTEEIVISQENVAAFKEWMAQ